MGAMTAAALTLSLMMPLEGLFEERDKLAPLYQTELASDMLAQVDHLPDPEPRTIHASFRPNTVYSDEQLAALSDDEKARVRTLEFAPSDSYSTFYGSPLVYARIIDLYQHARGKTSLDGSRILDLGYGQLGQLRLWAQMGADVVGVEVDPILTALYQDSPLIGDLDDDPSTPGSIALIEGAFPQDAEVRDQVGHGYDLIVSRNLLKRGYVKPEQVNPAYPEPVAWGMSDHEALSVFFDILAPGGYIIIESLGPAPDPSKPWSDITNPWDQDAWEDAGFEVVEHDAQENEFVRKQGKALGWDETMDLDTGLFGVYSIYKKPD